MIMISEVISWSFYYNTEHYAPFAPPHSQLPATSPYPETQSTGGMRKHFRLFVPLISESGALRLAQIRYTSNQGWFRFLDYLGLSPSKAAKQTTLP